MKNLNLKKEIRNKNKSNEINWSSKITQTKIKVNRINMSKTQLIKW